MDNKIQTLAERLRKGLPQGSITKLAEDCGVSRQTVAAQLADADKNPNAPVVLAALEIIRGLAAQRAAISAELDTLLPSA